MALIAVMALPSVPFLKPIGIDKPEAISRWVWLSVVRAPMAVQLIRSAMYWGTTGSSSSVAAGRPISAKCSKRPRATRSPVLMS